MLSYGIPAVFLGILLYVGWKFTARGAYETARYSVITAEESFEVREYADLVLVTTPMRFDARGNDGSFSRLFRYISGNNNEQQKVAMTTPVFMQRGEDTTAKGSEPAQQGQMSFVVPEQIASGGAPQPGNATVQLRNREGGRFAALRFSGRMEDVSLEELENELRQWMKQQNLVATGPVEFAGYDPPWTPGFLRRNEILMRVE